MRNKLLIIIMAIVLLMPQEVFALRPMATRTFESTGVPNELGRTVSECPWLPSEEDLLSIARAERTAVISKMKLNDPILEMIKLIDEFLHWQITFGAPGVILERQHFEHLAAEIDISLDELLDCMNLPRGTEALVIIHEQTEGPRNRVLLEEITHLLEGNPQTDKRWVEGKGFLDIQEAVNDLLLLMFYPSDKVAQFQSGHTRWTNEEHRALISHYRDRPQHDPNMHMRKIIQMLQNDIRRGASIQVGGIKINITELLSRRDEDSLGFDIEDLKVYLEILLDRERFSKHQPLFPNWHFPVEETPAEMVRRETSALYEKIQPGMDEVETLIGRLSPEEILSEDMQSLLDTIRNRCGRELFRICRDNFIWPYLRKSEEVGLDENHKVIFRALADTLNSVSSGVFSTADYADQSIRDSELTDLSIRNMKRWFSLARNVIMGLQSISEVRLNTTLNGIFIPGIDEIEYFPKLMHSFRTEISEVGVPVEGSKSSQGTQGQDDVLREDVVRLNAVMKAISQAA